MDLVASYAFNLHCCGALCFLTLQLMGDGENDQLILSREVFQDRKSD